ncbi:hypothetical protein NQ314_004455 [Rhamnusium bicolor]|uniref:Uncharacterized protein n=1 Tax=Rhamnusium bicolor TaxID=1586634 RepID=A0AAV8ZJH4_9CUCU|nr:hypothetical protein NQ314_004455 [Rhamnusium bicolor]
MDGLLIESETVYDKIIGDIAREYGKEYTIETKLKILGTTEKGTANVAVTMMQLPISPEDFLVTYKEKS